ncbi:hypothetical protein [Pedobacter nutrimenti]|uniref:Uncharacterized protein n=1 Tax=Pedobacter nutrimenti TaxID=1241337 RepID=A0A318UER1_9SPHI|nr:hypothetical protein [Pedobacter nutrimenti]PYF74573.1 hypothetical protein B0O44_10318 [Pedobacter nutrimenti]
MNVSFKIFHWADEIIHPKALINEQITNDELLKLENGFLNQLKKDSELIFTEANFSKKRILFQIRQLINLSNTIYGYLFRLSPAWKRKIHSSQLRQIYLRLLDALEKVIVNVQQIMPETYFEIPVTYYGMSLLKMQIKKAVGNFSIVLQQLQIDKKLYDLLMRDFYIFLNKKEITRYEIDYIINLIKEVEYTNVFDTLELIKILFLHGFNPRDFFYYYTSDLNNRLKSVPDLHDQLQVIISEQDRFYGLPESKLKMFSSLSSIEGQFKAFLSQKKRSLKEVINLRRVIIEDEQGAKTKGRLKVFLSVPQLSLFIRVLIEKGLLPKENIGELFNFFATHFSTPQTSFISAESLRKKSTDVEFSTAQKLKGHLIGMLNWLNENYNLSNYKNS